VKEAHCLPARHRVLVWQWRVQVLSAQIYLSVSVASSEFGPKKLYANLCRAESQDDVSLYALTLNLKQSTASKSSALAEIEE
jgi:hypothetical protein